MTYYNATSGESHVIDAREVAPAKAEEQLTSRSQSYTGVYLAIQVGQTDGRNDEWTNQRTDKALHGRESAT